MRWFWQKKKEPVEPEVLKELKMQVKRKMQTFEVGCTTVLVIFDDGREVHTKIYGGVDQYVDHYSNLYGCRENPTIYPAHVVTSVEKYSFMINSLKPGEIVKVVDDEQKATVAWVGRIQHMEIHETTSHTIDYMVAYLAPDLT